MIGLRDMVANQSVSQEGADLLRTIGADGHSFLVYALPRNAGKSTMTEAILAETPASVPRQEFFGTEDEVASLSALPTRGYLVVAEIGHRGRPGYLAEEEVGRAFQLLADGYSLASSLHADSVDEVFDVLGRNGIASTAAAAAIRYLVKVRALGDTEDPATPRVVEQIHQIASSGSQQLLYQWDGLALRD